MSKNLASVIWNQAGRGRRILALLAFTAGAWGQSAQDLKLIVGRSVVIDYPADIARISTSNPEVVDYAAVTTREILVHAKSYGSATLIVWSKSGQREFYNITVDVALEPIRKLLKDTFPNEDIHIQSVKDTITLTGNVNNQGVSDRAAALVSTLAKSVVNNLGVNSVTRVEKQILLRVKFGELNRSKAQSFGVNLLSTGAGNTIGRTAVGGVPAPQPSTIGQGRTDFSIGDALNVFAFRPDLNIAAFVRALQSQSVLQILAEPNLVTSNGKEASFLVGGEFPVPILQGGSNAGAVTVQFKEFGIRLTFNPLLTENNTLKMYVKPEVSTIDLSNSVTLSGFTIPALATRRMETNIELGQGQSFVIAGLMDDRVTESLARIPGLANVPLLGQLFKTKTENKSKQELLVMVTPEIIDPMQTPPTKSLEYPKEFMPRWQDEKDAPKKPAAAPKGAGTTGSKSGEKTSAVKAKSSTKGS